MNHPSDIIYKTRSWDYERFSSHFLVFKLKCQNCKFIFKFKKSRKLLNSHSVLMVHPSEGHESPIRYHSQEPKLGFGTIFKLLFDFHEETPLNIEEPLNIHIKLNFIIRGLFIVASSFLATRLVHHSSNCRVPILEQ